MKKEGKNTSENKPKRKRLWSKRESIEGDTGHGFIYYIYLKSEIFIRTGRLIFFKIMSKSLSSWEQKKKKQQQLQQQRKQLKANQNVLK